ncbi:hypothetical protein GCM10027342_48370 [Photobacterium alginatilyticum]
MWQQFGPPAAILAVMIEYCNDMRGLATVDDLAQRLAAHPCRIANIGVAGLGGMDASDEVQGINNNKMDLHNGG